MVMDEQTRCLQSSIETKECRLERSRTVRLEFYIELDQGHYIKTLLFRPHTVVVESQPVDGIIKRMKNDVITT